MTYSCQGNYLNRFTDIYLIMSRITFNRRLVLTIYLYIYKDSKNIKSYCIINFHQRDTIVTKY